MGLMMLMPWVFVSLLASKTQQHKNTKQHTTCNAHVCAHTHTQCNNYALYHLFKFHVLKRKMHGVNVFTFTWRSFKYLQPVEFWGQSRLDLVPGRLNFEG